MEEITKEEIKRLMEIPGTVRGEVFLTTGKYIQEKKGKEGLKQVEEEMGKLGHPLYFDRIKSLDWYPIGLRGLHLIAVKKAFNWGDEELIDMGNAAPKYSFIVKLLMRHFLSLKMIFKQSPKYWAQHYAVGKLEFIEVNEKENYGIVRVHNFKIHPVLCTYYLGYFKRIVQFSGKKNVTIEETKCMFRGDPYHEYVGRWD